MEETEKDNLYQTFQAVINSIVREKKTMEKYDKLFETFEARVNLGLQMEDDYYFWVNLIIEDGEVSLNRGKLEDNYDLILLSAPEDLMFFTNGENSTLHMLMKKNRFGERKLRFKKGTTGLNLGKLLKLSKLLVLD